MGVATNNAWTGSYVGNTLDGVDQFASILSAGVSSRREIVHFMTTAGNVSYQYDEIKTILDSAKNGGYQLPAHYFTGNASMTIGECMVDTA